MVVVVVVFLHVTSFLTVLSVDGRVWVSKTEASVLENFDFLFLHGSMSFGSLLGTFWKPWKIKFPFLETSENEISSLT